MIGINRRAASIAGEVAAVKRQSVAVGPSSNWRTPPARQSRWYGVVAIAAVGLAAAEALALYLDNGFDSRLGNTLWQIPGLPLAVLIYMLAIQPIVYRLMDQSLQQLRPLIELSDAQFCSLTRRASPRAWQAAVAALAGIGGVILIQSAATIPLLDRDSPYFRTSLVVTMLRWLMLAAAAWIIYDWIAHVRVLHVLQRQRLATSVFDDAVFQSITGRNAGIVLTIMGGSALSILFLADARFVLGMPGMVIYPLAVLTPLAVFFVAVLDSHAAMAATRREELAWIEQQMAGSYSAMRHDAAPSFTEGLMALGALAALEKRFLETPTWPFNSGVVRDILASTALPLAVWVLRLVLSGTG